MREKHARLHAHTHARTHIHTPTGKHTHTHARAHTRTHTHTDAHTHILTHMHAHTHTCTNAPSHAHAHTHTHTHSLTHSHTYAHARSMRVKIWLWYTDGCYCWKTWNFIRDLNVHEVEGPILWWSLFLTHGPWEEKEIAVNDFIYGWLLLVVLHWSSSKCFNGRP